MEFEEACCEMDYILEHMPPEDLSKIPITIREIFKNNKSVFYNVKLDETKPLKEQSLKEETKAFIQIINMKYLEGASNEKIYNELLDISEDVDEKNIEFLKKESESERTDLKELVIYKENKLIAFIKKILEKFKS